MVKHIVYGLLIFFVLLALNDHMISGRKCNEYVRYYDKMYYQLPVVEEPKDLNEQTADTGDRQPAIDDTAKPVEAMWNSKPSHQKSSRVESFDDAALNQIMSKASNKALEAADKSKAVWNTLSSDP